MMNLSTATVGRNTSYEPLSAIGAWPLPTNAASADRLRIATRAQTTFAPSSYGQNGKQPTSESDLPTKLFEALASFKLKTAILAVAHFTTEERSRLFRQLDSLLDTESWDDSDVVVTDASFTTLLRMVLFLKGRRPGLGVSAGGNFIATWTEGDDRLTIECRPADQVRWVMVQKLEGLRERAAGDTTIKRLTNVLRPYDAPNRWFPNVTNQASA